MRKRILCLLATILLVATATGTGSAQTGLNGGFATAGNSWTRLTGFGAAGYTFDAFEIFIISDTGAGPFQNDGMFDFDLAGWTGSALNPLYTVATGPAFNTSISWTFDFAGNMADTVTIDALFWNGGVFGSLDFAASFSFVNGSFDSLVQSFGGPYDFLQHSDGIGYNRSGLADRTLIIKQGACPAPVNPASRGLTPMLLVGDEDFDVSEVDLSSLELTRCDGVGDAVAPHSGPLGPGPRIVDLNHPNVDEVGCGDGQVPCACNADQSSDGIDDLELKFDTSDMAEAFMLDGEPTGVPITLFLTGELEDGSQFVAADCIRTVGPPVAAGVLHVGATVTGMWVGVTPLDLIFDGGGFASFERSYPLGSVVELSAPTTYNGWVFLGWDLNGLPVDDVDPPVFITVTDETMSAFARYRLLGDLNDDGVVGVPDLLALLGAWGPCPSCSNCPADVDGDCQVGVPDLLILLANWD